MAVGSATMVSKPEPVCLKHILLSEILSVTSVMRKNSRWAMSTHSFSSGDSALAHSLGLRRTRQYPTPYVSDRGSNEQELMRGFQELRRLAKDVEGMCLFHTTFTDHRIRRTEIRTVPLPTLLAPFFAIIRSPLSTGPITSAALSALHTFFQCELIRPDAISVEAALSELSNTVSRCKFEASDSSGDEVTLLKIMTVIQDCMCGTVGDLLGDIEICEMLETVLTTCCQMRLSGGCPPLQATANSVLTYTCLARNEEILRRSAEATMHALVKTAFMRLYVLDPEEEEAKLADNANDGQEGGEAKMTVTTDVQVLPPSEPDVASEQAETVEVKPEEPAEPPPEEKTLTEERPEPEVDIARQKCELTTYQGYCAVHIPFSRRRTSFCTRTVTRPD